ncbi:unnamed protein product, partial [Bubo scandiacus]
IPSLSLLAMPFLIQARIPLALLATWAHCWLMFSQLSINTPSCCTFSGYYRGKNTLQMLYCRVEICIHPHFFGFHPKKNVKLKFNLLQIKTTTIQPKNKAANQNKEEEEFFSNLFSRPHSS